MIDNEVLAQPKSQEFVNIFGLPEKKSKPKEKGNRYSSPMSILDNSGDSLIHK